MADTGKHVLTGEICKDEKVLSGQFPSEKVRLGGSLPGTLVVYTAGDLPQYEGAYEVVPAQQEQALPTAGKYLKEDIRVEKIPERYGLITYNQDKIITIT